MKRILLLAFLMVALLCLPYVVVGDRTIEAAKPATASCKACHADFASVLPKAHPPVKGTDLAACISCHAPDLAGTAQKNAFSSRMHRAHVAPKGSLDCTACHTWTPGKTFGLIGQKGSWGAPKKDDMVLMKQIVSSWAGSNYTDNLHAMGGIACTQCHGKGLPKADDTVENSRCLACHGPMDKLAQKTEPKDFKDRNPHKSHLGDIACTVCHKGHSESKVYCLGCHQNFKMKIQEESRPPLPRQDLPVRQPRHLKGDDILMEVYIMAVVDVVESMVSHRPYRPALGIDAALDEIEKNKGILCDDAVANACLRLFREKNYQLP